jgi:hypothetical protein
MRKEKKIRGKVIMNNKKISLLKVVPCFLILLLVLTGLSWADVYIKQERQTEDVYHHGNVEPGETVSIELWIGEGKLAFKEGKTGLMVDQANGKAFVLSHGTKTFAETALPVNLDNVADEKFVPMLQMYRRHGEIEPMNEEKKIGERNCKLTEITTWISFEGNRYYETVSEVWLTTDLPFDLKKAESLLKELEGMNNLNEELYKEMVALEGFPIEINSTRYIEGVSVPSTMKILEMVEKEAPPGTYTVPKDYTKKEKLTREELLGR